MRPALCRSAVLSCWWLLWCLGPPALLGGDLRVKSWKVIENNGGRLSWSAAKGLIAFDREGADGFYDVWTMNPDGSNQVCLTCNATVLPKLNRGNPAWHPSGDFIVFQVQKDILLDNKFGRPGVGVNNDVWIMDAQGKQYWQVTNVPLKEGGVLHPHFSNKGDKLLWSERVSSFPLLSGSWVLRLADVAITNQVPSVQNIQTLTPGRQNALYESHGFSPDDKLIFFSGNLTPGQSEAGIDIYSLDLTTSVLTNLTNTLNEWDEHSRPMPSGDKLVWMSSRRTSSTLGQLKTEYWMMDYDGSDQNQLTWFNDPRGQDFMAGGVAVGDSDWNADGSKLAAYLVEGGTGLGGGGKIAILEFEPSTTTVSAATFARPPLAPNSIVSIFGSALATGVAEATSLPLPITLAGTSVMVADARGTQRPAPLFYAAPSQVNCAIPAGTAPGPAVITVTNAVNAQFRGTVDIETVAPGLFSANQDGRGVAAAYIQRVLGDGSQSLEFVFDCAGPGQCAASPIDLGGPSEQVFLILFGTGIRNRSSQTGVSVRIGGQAAEVQYAGPQGLFEGLDQVNVRLPRTLAGAGLVDISLDADGNPANVLQVRIK